MDVRKRDYEEKEYRGKNGYLFLLLTIALLVGGTVMLCLGISRIEMKGGGAIDVVLVVAGLVLMSASLFILPGLKTVSPNEAIVLLLFGKYKGTLMQDGFFWVNPFCTGYNPGAQALARPGVPVSRKLSLKAMTLNNDKQKVNDLDGNPIEIGVVVIWRIINTAKAVFNVENYATFVSTQADSSIRQVARKYPYDVSDEGDEKSLRGSAQEIADMLKEELQERTAAAGIEIIEARISHLAYAPEIAAAMLQRQQAGAIIAARKMIVEGAVGMVEMALEKLNENDVVKLDEERKAAMVSNLLVVLCGNRDAQPIVNSGSIY